MTSTNGAPTHDSLPAWFSPEWFADPVRAARGWQAAGPVHQVRLPNGLPAYVVTRYADVLAAMHDPGLDKDADELIRVIVHEFASIGIEVTPAEVSVLISTSILFSSGADHARLRGPVAKAFSTRRVRELEPTIRQTTVDLLDAMDRVPDGDPVDLLDALASPVPVRVIAALLGAPESDAAHFRDWSEKIMDDLDLPLSRAAGEQAGGYFVELCAAKSADLDPERDLTSALLAAERAGELDRSEVISALILLLVAGNDSTKNSIAGGVVRLLSHPTAWQELRDDPGLVPGAVQELQRLVSSVRMTAHFRTRTAVTIGGVEIPPDKIVFLWLGAANLDPEMFGPTAGELDIRRPDARRHLAFGHGVHHCLGAALATRQTEIVLTELLRRYPNPKLAVPADELRWRQAWVAAGHLAVPFLR